MKMRKSRVLEKLRKGEVVSSFYMGFSESRIAELAAMHGFDCIWICMEHVSNTWSDVENLINAAKIHDVDVMVRVARGSYSDYIKPLELDAAGIMVPHLMSVDDARDVVRMTRFQPIGRRPLDGSNADGKFANVDLKEYISKANEQRFLCVQIEDPEPLDDLEAIAAFKGIDMLFFGPCDFSHAIGAPGEWNHPKLIEARKRVAETARKYGKYAATTGDIESLPELIDIGYQFIALGYDAIGMNEYCSRIITIFRKQCRQHY